MERRTLVWIITLVVLLVAAVFSTVFFKLELDAADEKASVSQVLHETLSVDLAETEERLKEAEESAAAEIDVLETAVSDYAQQVAALEAAGAEKDEYIASLEAEKAIAEEMAVLSEENARLKVDLDAAIARVSELENQLSLALEAAAEEGEGDELAVALSEIETLKAQLAEVEGQLEVAEADRDSLTAELAAVNARAAELEGELEKALASQAESDESRVAELEAELEKALANQAAPADDSRVTELEDELLAANAAAQEAEGRIADLEQQLADAVSAQESVNDEKIAALETELDSVRAELDAYKTAHSAVDGEKHASAEMDERVVVGSDGVSAAYSIVNNSASGNSVIFELVLGDELLYQSGEIAPGEELCEFVLAKKLEAGEYEATAIMTTMNADGEVSSNLMLPVTVVVTE